MFIGQDMSSHSINSLESQIERLTAENSALQRDVEVKSCLFEISLLYTFEFEAQELYKRIYEIMLKVFTVDNFYIALKDSGTLKIPFFVDVKDDFEAHELDENTNPDLKNSLTSYAINNGGRHILTKSEIKQLTDDEHLNCYGELPEQWIFFPFSAPNLQGGISVQTYHLNSKFSEDDICRLGYMAYHIGNVLSQRKINMELIANNEEIKKTQVQLVQSEKLASIGHLAAGVAHEINNPLGYVNSNLNSLNSYLEDITVYVNGFKPIFNESQSIEESHLKAEITNLKAMEKELDIDYLIDDIKEIIGESVFGLNKVKDIVQSLKNFSRVEQDKMQEANLNECIEETLKIVWNDLKYTCEIEKNYADMEDIYCYPGQINQVIMNLLVNAGHAIEEKGTITISTYMDGPNSVLEIKDTGKGIKPENLNNLFDPFFTTKPVGQGTGLGLSVSYDIIVEKHFGKLDVKSKLGKGTTFRIKLPNQKLKSVFDETCADNKKDAEQ